VLEGGFGVLASFFNFGGGFFSLLLFSKLNSVMLEIPLSEWGGINLNDAVLDESLGSNKLVISSIVDNI
jgi:hypothetical protein